MTRRMTLPAAAIIACCLVPGAVRAETFHTCAGFIDAVPAVLTTQGTWCLRGDLASNLDSGNLITVATNNITLDCNGFKIGGLGAGTGTLANGIRATNRSNIAIRNCTIRGFAWGIALVGTGGGHAIEDNRLDGNTIEGIRVEGDGSMIRGNLVRDTGPSTALATQSAAIGTFGAVDIRDNIVDRVESSAGLSAFGIFMNGNDRGTAIGNRVGDLVAPDAPVYGIYSLGAARATIADNSLVGFNDPGSVGIWCQQGLPGIARDNVITGFSLPVMDCVEYGTIAP